MKVALMAMESAKYGDGVILVVRSQTLAEKVQCAKIALEHVQAKILGVILNRTRL
jgi:Mrp family chromosome partitioning ATPase